MLSDSTRPFIVASNHTMPRGNGQAVIWRNLGGGQILPDIKESADEINYRPSEQGYRNRNRGKGQGFVRLFDSFRFATARHVQKRAVENIDNGDENNQSKKPADYLPDYCF